AKVAVVAISDPQATAHGLWLIKELNPAVYTVIRTRSNEDVAELIKLGADEVIPEEFETSIEIFSRVLSKYHVPRNVIEQEVKIIRKGNYGMFRTASLTPGKLMDLQDILNLTLTDTLLIKNGSKAAGKTLVELNLRTETGTTVIAVVREGEAVTNPKGEFILAENDVVVLLGNHIELDKAAQYLAGLEKNNRGLEA
ncbi:MAG: TrkA C-terminal domain-containing protein, partial [Candidatus Firestonebacteria bacterium]